MLVYVPYRPFQPSLTFVRLPKSGAPERCITLVGSGLTCKYWTKLERLPKDKNSNLLRTLVNYTC